MGKVDSNRSLLISQSDQVTVLVSWLNHESHRDLKSTISIKSPNDAYDYHPSWCGVETVRDYISGGKRTGMGNFIINRNGEVSGLCKYA